MNRRQVLTSAAAAALLTGFGPILKAQSAPHTFVLIAGAFSGGWIWNRVAQKLRSEGHVVYAPSNTGVAERSHLLSASITLDTFVRDIAGVIEVEELSDVVLVGHSFGGIPISGTAELVPSRIKQLVYLDALVVQPGKSAFDGLPAEVVAARRKAAQDTSGGLSLPVPPPASFADLGITQEADIAWLKRRFTPHPLGAYDTPLLVKNPIGRVPMLEFEDGRCLAESGAILFHLAEGSALIPKDPWARAKMLEWMFFEQYEHEPYVAVARRWLAERRHAVGDGLDARERDGAGRERS